MRTKVLYRSALWEIGEVRPAGADLSALAEIHAALPPERRYPKDHSGRVISVVPEDHEFTLKELADPRRQVIELDLTDDEVAAAKSRTLKVGGFGLEPVTFTDRWGAVGEALRAKHADPEAFERDEAAAVEAAEAANEAARERFDLEQLAFEIARRDYARDLVCFAPALGLDAPVAPEPPAPPVFTEHENAFEREADALARSLPPTITHSGAGLYEVGPGKTYSTIQSALDQLWADQGATEFAATQEIRIYDGTYVENVVLSAFRPLTQYPLIFKAASGNTSVIVSNSGTASYTFHCAGVCSVWFQDFCVKSLVSGIRGVYAVGQASVFDHMEIDGEDTTTSYGLQMQVRGILVQDCHIHNIKNMACEATWNGNFRIESTRFVDCGGTVLFTNSISRCTVLACDFVSCPGSILRGGVAYNRPPGREGWRFSNCSFYNCGTLIQDYGTAPRGGIAADVHNCAFHTMGTVYSSLGDNGYHIFDCDHNVYYNCTHIASIAGVDYDDLAAWRAFVDENGDSPDANSFDTDPRFTNPGAGDLSLAADSPFKWRVPSAGVARGSNGVAYDEYFCDVGSWSSGPAPRPGTPTISVADDGTGTSFTVTMAAADEAHEYYVYYRKTTAAAPTLWATPRTGSGDIQVTGVGEYGYVVDVVGTRNGDPTRNPSLAAVDYVKVTTGSVAAAGAVSLPLENVRTLLANSAAFQSLVGAANATEAKTKIHYPALTEASWSRPRALIGHLAPSPAHALAGRGVGNTFSESGSTKVLIEADIGASYKAAGQEENAWKEFANTLGVIMTEMEALAGTGGYLDAQNFEVGPVFRGGEPEEALSKYWYRGTIALRWGVRG